MTTYLLSKTENKSTADCFLQKRVDRKVGKCLLKIHKFSVEALSIHSYHRLSTLCHLIFSKSLMSVHFISNNMAMIILESFTNAYKLKTCFKKFLTFSLILDIYYYYYSIHGFSYWSLIAGISQSLCILLVGLKTTTL